MFDNNVIKHKFSDFSRNNTISVEKNNLLSINTDKCCLKRRQTTIFNTFLLEFINHVCKKSFLDKNNYYFCNKH
ncbi:type I restriction enzyme R protein [Paludibacter propionicigenes WB4]|uniref:Type I restriction enzyme R protein n=1 Tax=Paludibacter propionicigenes (strain DSM 17365 / JCM 13257 / WB4) TaxID=694427 RepID=E4T8P1_PALPW|nr:type I restriction enzyme R protein [Paludibacter propionicigenes WB4]